jgi:GxxExxY protein
VVKNKNQKDMITKSYLKDLTYKINGAAIEVHKELGPGLLESVYQKCLKYELIRKGFKVDQQVLVPVVYGSICIETDLRLDLLINDCIIVELKAIEHILPVHEAQILTYMKLLQKPQGLLINFYTDNITKSMKPFVNEYYKLLPE